MATEKQPEEKSEEVARPANDWFLQFSKHIELHFADSIGELLPSNDVSGLQAVALRAVYRTLLDSGMQPEEIATLFGTTVICERQGDATVEWIYFEGAVPYGEDRDGDGKVDRGGLRPGRSTSHRRSR